eukprot:9674607-Lingulodinium_polyedra.AAC.1
MPRASSNPAPDRRQTRAVERRSHTGPRARNLNSIATTTMVLWTAAFATGPPVPHRRRANRLGHRRLPHGRVVWADGVVA